VGIGPENKAVDVCDGVKKMVVVVPVDCERAGMARAKREGKHVGRPPIASELEERIRAALAVPGRPGVRVIARQFGVNPGTVQRISISRPFEASVVAGLG